MPFSTTASVISTDLDNMLRGLYRDNSNHAVTGTVAETDLASVSITANTIGATGCLYIMASGTTAGINNTKTARIYIGATLITQIVVPGANTDDWHIWCWIYNTATNAQRICVFAFRNAAGGGASTLTSAYTTAAIDTTANQTVKITAQLANAADTMTGTIFDLFLAQIN